MENLFYRCATNIDEVSRPIFPMIPTSRKELYDKFLNTYICGSFVMWCIVSKKIVSLILNGTYQ